MRAIAGYFDISRGACQPRAAFTSAIGLGDTHRLAEVPVDGGVLFAVPGPGESATPAVKDGILVLQAGRILDGEPSDWTAIAKSLRRGEPTIPEMAGRFSICLLDQPDQHLYLLSDFLGQFPLFYCLRGGQFAYSTSQGSFVGLEDPPGFDPRWLYELFAFNFSPRHRSFLQDVRRIPAASVLDVDLRTGRIKLHPYAKRLHPRPPTGSREDEVAEALRVFHDRAPLFLKEGERPVAGLTSGFDSRTILALFMDSPGFRTFTYGIPGCIDIEEASQLASQLGLAHDVVPFDQSFEQVLPTLAIECVWQSGGLQNCIRSTLLYAYRNIARIVDAPSVVLSGVSGDQLFRGHGNVPNIVSRIMDLTFRGQDSSFQLIDTEAALFRDDDAFRANVHETLEELTEDIGPLDRPEAAMDYLAYVVPAEYFVGEALLADRYVDFRTPFCDPEIVNLAYRISLSSLEFSRFSGSRADNLLKNYLPANLIASNPRLRSTLIMDRPLSAFASGNRPRYFVASAWSRATRRLRLGTAHVQRPRLEDWERWFAGPLGPLARNLLGEDSRLGAYIRPSSIRDALRDADPRRASKLLSAEILLRLIENDWQVERVAHDGGI